MNSQQYIKSWILWILWNSQNCKNYFMHEDIVLYVRSTVGQLPANLKIKWISTKRRHCKHFEGLLFQELALNLTKPKSLSRNFDSNPIDLRAYFWIYLFVSFFSEQPFTIINFCQIKFNNRNKLNYKETITTAITLFWCVSWSDFKLFANHVVESECVFVEISVMKRHLVTML